MPSNKDLIKDIAELDANAVTADLKNDELAALLKKLREVPAEPEVVVAEATGHTVAQGKAITSKRGVLEGGDAISADDLGGGEDALEALCASKHVVEAK